MEKIIPFEIKKIPQETTDKNLKDPRKIIVISQISKPIEINPTEKRMTNTQGNQTTTVTTSPEHKQNLNFICQESETSRKRTIGQTKHPEDIRDRTKYYKLTSQWNYFKIIGGNVNKHNGDFKYILKNCHDTGFRFQATEKQFELVETSNVITQKSTQTIVYTA